jgi:hypothetical protein
VALMSAPFGGPPAVPFDTVRQKPAPAPEPINAALARLSRNTMKAMACRTRYVTISGNFDFKRRDAVSGPRRFYARASRPTFTDNKFLVTQTLVHDANGWRIASIISIANTQPK